MRAPKSIILLVLFNKKCVLSTALTTDVVDSLQEQLNASNLKVSEYRNQVQSLKQDMKVALKVQLID